MKYLRRTVWYIASRLFLICAVLGLIVTVFYYAMNATNLYVVVKDGMARRAQTAMMTEDGSELAKYFSASFIEQDPTIQAAKNGTSPYVNYNIRGIDHRVELSFFWIWPWEELARVEITEMIPRIDGRAKGSVAEALVAAAGSEALYPPRWQGGRYRVLVRKENDAWHIVSLTLLEVLTE